MSCLAFVDGRKLGLILRSESARTQAEFVKAIAIQNAPAREKAVASGHVIETSCVLLLFPERVAFQVRCLLYLASSEFTDRKSVV